MMVGIEIGKPVGISSVGVWMGEDDGSVLSIEGTMGEIA
jgi:hypothetical protein